MKKLSVFLLLFLLIAAITDLQAQSRFAVTLQGGYGTGAYEPMYSGLVSGGFAFRLTASYAFMPILDGYAAYSRTSFKCENTSFCVEPSAPVDFISSGLSLGARLNRGPNASVWIPWLRAGLVYHTFEWTDQSESYSDSGIGFEVGVGLAYPVTPHIKIVPSVNYSRYSITAKDGFDASVVTVTGLIGARYEF